MSSPTPHNYRHFMHYQDSNTEASSNYNIDQYSHMDLNRQQRQLIYMNLAFLSQTLPERDSRLSEEDFKANFFRVLGRLAQGGSSIFEAMHRQPMSANRQSAQRSSRLISHRQQSHLDLSANVDPHPPSQKSHTHPLPEVRDGEKDSKQKEGKKKKDANKPPGASQVIHPSVMRRTNTQGNGGLPIYSFPSMNSRNLSYEASERNAGRFKSRSSRSEQIMSAYQYVTPIRQNPPIKKTKFRKTPARLNRFNLGMTGLYDMSLPHPFNMASQPKNKSKSPPGGKKLKRKSGKGAKGDSEIQEGRQGRKADSQRWSSFWPKPLK